MDEMGKSSRNMVNVCACLLPCLMTGGYIATSNGGTNIYINLPPSLVSGGWTPNLSGHLKN